MMTWSCSRLRINFSQVGTAQSSLTLANRNQTTAQLLLGIDWKFPLNIVTTTIPRSYEWSLIQRLNDKPFALIGVNSDTDKVELKKRMAKEKITWRSFWAGPEGTAGPIPKKWNIRGWPTVFVLDAKGVIRYKDLREKELDVVVDQLIAEIEADDAKKKNQ